MQRTQGSMICPQCGKLIGVSEERCPFCGAWRPGLYGAAPAMQRWFGRRLDLGALILTSCVVLYGLSLALQPGAIFRARSLFSILSPGDQALLMLGMTGSDLLRAGWWWTLLTANYLHGGLLHLFFNMMWIRSLVPQLSEAYGPARTFVIFSVAGAVGFLASDLLGVPYTIGASAGVFGLLAAMIVYARKRSSPMVTSQLWQWALINFAMGFILPHVNNWAHAGGFAGGWVVASFMPFVGERREGRLVQITALILIAATALGFLLSLLKTSGIL